MSITKFFVTGDFDKIKSDTENLIDGYMHLGNKGQNEPYEKALIVKYQFFNEFFLNCDKYMAFNEDGISFPKDDNEAMSEAQNWLNPILRKRDSTSKTTRDASFRRKVLEKYNYRCAICGCDVVSVLQAAHEHGHTIAGTVRKIPDRY